MPTAGRHTRNALTAWGTPRTTLDDAALVVSELVTNAQQHTAHGPTELCLLAHGNWLIVSVHDPRPAAHIPIPGPTVGPDDERGRGLDIVHKLTQASGGSGTPTGKTVWALLTVQTA